MPHGKLHIPPMKLASLALFVCLAPAWAQSSPAALSSISDETVVATFDDGAKMTMGDFKRIYAVLPAENQQQAMQNRQAFVQQWALMRKLASMAETEKLDQMSPSKEALEYYRLVILSQARMNMAVAQTTVLPSEVAAHYDSNKDKYKQVRVKAIYIGFGGKKLTEADARAKASQIRTQARDGADFVKLVRAHSDDETSRAKDGEFATLHLADNIPDAVRDAIFKLKEGEISEPVRQPNGFYLFRAEQITYRPLAEVRDEIFNELKQARYNEWVETINRGAKVLFSNPAFIGAVPFDTTPRK